ncbi:MAG: glycosyltransferase family 4 protein [bacterium]|jgi:glycosyltransferase involved in cell wall biosynthesis|nr:glycosyltransferase family 4 protein [bacterium]
MSKPLELLIVSTNRWDYGGAEKVLYLLTTERNPAVYNPTLVISQEDHFASMLEKADLPYHVKDFSSYPRALFQMKAFFKENAGRFQAVLCNSSMAARVVGFLKPWHRLPVIFYAHGRRGWASQALLQRLSDRVIAVSRFIASTFPQPDHPGLTVLHNGIPLPASSTNVEKKEIKALSRTFGLNHGPVIGSVGRLSRVKGYHDLLAAFPPIIARHPQTRLLLVGEGGERENLEQLTKQLEISENVVFTGFQSHVAPFFELMDVFVLPSTWQEPFGLVVIEAMAARLPVVATRLGGVPEIVLHEANGLLVDKNQPDDIARAVNRLLDSPETASAMGELGRTRAENLFNHKLMVRKFEELIQTAVHERSN